MHTSRSTSPAINCAGTSRFLRLMKYRWPPISTWQFVTKVFFAISTPLPNDDACGFFTNTTPPLTFANNCSALSVPSAAVVWVAASILSFVAFAAAAGSTVGVFVQPLIKTDAVSARMRADFVWKFCMTQFTKHTTKKSPANNIRGALQLKR